MGELLRAAAAFLICLLAAVPSFAQTGEGGKKPAGAKKAEPVDADASGAPAAEEGESPAAPAEGEAAGGGAAGASATPADFWVLDFRYQKVGMFQPTEGFRRGEVYWYMLYRIENKTGQDREAYISITARSDRDRSYASIYLPDVEPLIERKVGKPLWGKSDEAQALKERAQAGEITAEKGTFNYFKFKAGEARDCVAIFNKLDPRASLITVAVEGLSNDLNLIQTEGGARQIQSRSYQLELERPGDEYAMNLDRVRLLRSGWTKKLTELAVKEE